MDGGMWSALLVYVLIGAPFLATLLILGISGLARLSAAPWVEAVRSRESWITTIASAISFLSAVALVNVPPSQPLIPFFLVDFIVDALSIYFVLLVNVVALVASFFISHYLKSVRELKPGERKEDLHSGRFHFFFNLFHLTMVLVPFMNNLVLLWIAVELTTVASAFLVGIRGDRQALEAAWKYTIITSTGVIFALLGTLFLASVAPESGTMQWYDLYRYLATHPENVNKNFAILSFLFVLIGYGTKAGFAPMHTWLPDGHGEAPYPVSALLSGVLLKSALYAILRFYILTLKALGKEAAFVTHILLASGLFSLGVAVPFILRRNKFKRILAYHSLEHMGIITFGLGIGHPIALFGALLHALNHALTKALMFLAFGLVQGEYALQVKTGDEEQYTGLLRVMPFTGLLIALGGLALVGSPPFNIFFSEFLILWGAFGQARHTPILWGAIVVFLLSVTLIFAGLVRHLGHLLLGNPPGRRVNEPAGLLGVLFLLFLSVFLFGVVVPHWDVLNLAQLLQDSVRILQGEMP